MYKDYEILEVTKENEDKYLHDIAELEELVLENMEKEGKTGQLFITGPEDISKYIHSKANRVFAATKENKVISAAYITHGQTPFTYNDITKYFKFGDEYKKYIKNKYKDSYIREIRDAYIKKVCAFVYARDCIIFDNGKVKIEKMSEEERNNRFMELVIKELNDPKNGFHEKSELREKLNRYMSLYMKNDIEKYNDFYWIDFNFLKQISSTYQKKQLERVTQFYRFDSTIKTYDDILELQKYKIYDYSNCKNPSEYFEANTGNTIELDTYITHPQNREKGIARILVFEGIKKAFEDLLRNKANKKIYLVSTLHQENYSSKYVSEFFGLKDYLFVNRRNGRDRQVHICGIDKEKVPEYLKMMEKKIAVIYDYNPNKINISADEQKRILIEQIQYEAEELQKLKGAKSSDNSMKYSGLIKNKKGKIQTYKAKFENLNNLKENDVEQEL